MDTLKTIGTLLPEGCRRDAIHIAVAPAIAAETLAPGEDIVFTREGDTETMGKSGEGPDIGIVDPFLPRPGGDDRMIDYTNLPFVQARWFREVPPGERPRRKIVIHSMEAPEKGATAEATAHYFAGLPESHKASAHYCVDNNSIIQSVQTKDVAFAAPGANRDGIHIELAGYARQTRGEWEDAYSTAMLDIAAGLCRFLAGRFKIPVVFLPATILKTYPASMGFTTHAEVTKAFHLSTHTDPGTGFPMDEFLTRVKS